ncbi:helix-turn-helix transcriptional regulator [Dactylosporangium sp. NPDC005572]|uniref:helix-turn-helix transcriptional regulator n=1 Tax=Dactylosporangium sp. NPDC005572 TaxID=3156889 RepID=UPI00339DF424
MTERDVRGLAGVVDARHDEPTDGLPWAVMSALAALVPCDAVSFYEEDTAACRTLLLQWDEPGDRYLGDDCDPPADEGFWAAARQFEPCTYPGRTGDLATAVRWSDFYSPAALRNAPLVAGYYGPGGLRHGMHLAFPAPHGQMRKVSFWRGPGRDFSDRDRLVAELVRPHLWEIHAEGRRRRAAAPRLTGREREVLMLVREGLSNAQIGRRLVIAESTVRKHLEHVFARTGARSRTAAAALVAARE